MECVGRMNVVCGVWRMEIVCGKDEYGVSSVEDGDSLWKG